jgi:epoxyqueuosine reductase QueG
MATNPAALKADPAQFLEREIKSFVLKNPENRLKDIDGSPIFEEPLVGFADGDDPLFREYKTIIGDFHLTPREALQKHLLEELNIAEPLDGPLSVISFILPTARETRVANRRMTLGPSVKWNHTRWYGQTLVEGLARHVMALLREQRFRAVAPGIAGFFKTVNLDNGMSSVWSERHAAYAAGLGTFGLSDGFITSRGMAMRCGSVVTDLLLPSSPQTYPSHTANCRLFSDGTCGLCATRCPAGAITAGGHDKNACRQYLFEGLSSWREKEGYIGKYISCGLCQTQVPCEARVPVKVSRRFIP